MAKPAIAIIGAGPAGLLLARILELKGIPATIFEGEASRHARSQGGTLDLHVNLGQKALKEAGLFSEFEKLARYEGEDLLVMDKSGGVFYEKKYERSSDESAASRPEIDRSDLRNILLDSISPETIKWSHRVKTVESRSDGRWDIVFRLQSTHYKESEVQNKGVAHSVDCPIPCSAADGEEKVSVFDLVVGADGAWSHIRPLLTDVKPSYSGVTLTEANIANVDLRQPEVAKYVGRGSVFVFADKKGFQLQRLGDGSVKIYFSLRAPEDWMHTCGIPFEDSQKTREAFSELYQDWLEVLKDVMRKCDDGFIARPLYQLPVGHSWEPRKGLTMIGDAAHLMTPFGGIGVNLALADAMELGLAISKGLDDWPAAVSLAEKMMFERTVPAATRTASNTHIFFADNSAELITDFIETQVKAHEH